MMFDKIEEFGKSIFQHGKYNDRIYLMKLAKQDFPAILKHLETKASSERYTKIFAKVPSNFESEFLRHNYQKEATIPAFFDGKEDAVFLSKYFSPERATNTRKQKIDEVLSIAKKKVNTKADSTLPQKFTYRICEKRDVQQMSALYKIVFETYPFPIHDPHYLAKTMDEHIVYFGIWDGRKLVALSSAEMDTGFKNVEMTDFATLSEYRGHGLAVYLLKQMEQEMRKRKFKTAYTIARALSYGMNITFAKMGYQFSGTLINNTNISGNLESMNVWYKYL